jgi:hypothetical protein
MGRRGLCVMTASNSPEARAHLKPAVPGVPLQEILPGGNFFLCTKTGCTLRMEICIKRQDIAAGERDFGYPTMRYDDCLGCQQGIQNRNSPAKGEKMKTKAEKEDGQNSRICEECNNEKTMSKSHKLGPRCMQARLKAKKEHDLASKTPDPPNVRPQTRDEIQKAALPPSGGEKIDPGANLRAEIDFAKHPDLLSRIETLAEEEVRPREHQIIYMLKRYLLGQQ